MMEDVDYYHFGHIMSKIDDPKIAKVIIDNMEKLPEDFEVDEFNGIDKEILFQIIEKFPELYCNEEKLFKLMPDNEDFAKLFIQRHPGKYKYERFLEEIIKYHFGNTYNYCFDLFKTEPSIPLP